VRRLAAAVDFSFVRGLTRKFYSHTGKPSVDPEVLFKLSLLGYLFNLPSERRLCEEASLNLAWRWFLGYELDEPIPDHSVLSKARVRYGPAVYERFFKRVVQLCEQHGLVEGDVLFVDSTLSKANASEKSFRSRSLLQPTLLAPQQYVAELWLENEEDEPPPRERDPRGRKEKPGAKWRASRSVTNEMSVSDTDPDAQMFKKPGQPAMLAHKTHLAVDGGKASVITAVEVRPACEADSQALEKILQKHEAALQRRPREAVADRGYGSERALKTCIKRGIQPTIAIRTLGNSSGGLNRDQFTYLAERDLFICPAGKELHHVTDKFHTRQAVYRPARGTCQGCPLKPQCAPGRSDRAVIRRWDAEMWEEIERHLASSHARRMLRRRHAISERIFADAKDKHGLTHARFRRRWKVQIQALLTATAMNLKQLAKRPPLPQSGWAVGCAAGHPMPVAAHRSAATLQRCTRPGAFAVRPRFISARRPRRILTFAT